MALWMVGNLFVYSEIFLLHLSDPRLFANSRDGQKDVYLFDIHSISNTLVKYIIIIIVIYFTVKLQQIFLSFRNVIIHAVDLESILLV